MKFSKGWMTIFFALALFFVDIPLYIPVILLFLGGMDILEKIR